MCGVGVPCVECLTQSLWAMGLQEIERRHPNPCVTGERQHNLALVVGIRQALVGVGL